MKNDWFRYAVSVIAMAVIFASLALISFIILLILVVVI